MRVLIVEDEPYLAEAVRDGLRLEAIAADIACDGNSALELLSVNSYDLAVLDRDIPGPSGDEVARRIVASGSGIPILMLTAADRIDDKASGFELGADDYLTKPFDFPELEARLRALLRRTRPLGNSAELGHLSFDRDTRRAAVRGETLDLSPREWMLLDLLLGQRDKVVTKEQIAQSWGADRSEASGPSSIEVYVHRVRRKLEHSGLAIRTVRGLGYLLEAQAPPPSS